MRIDVDRYVLEVVFELVDQQPRFASASAAELDDAPDVAGGFGDVASMLLQHLCFRSCRIVLRQVADRFEQRGAEVVVEVARRDGLLDGGQARPHLIAKCPIAGSDAAQCESRRHLSPIVTASLISRLTNESRMRTLSIMRSTLIPAAASLLVVACFSGYSDEAPKNALRVRRGTFTRDVILTGELEAARGAAITVPSLPQWQSSIKWLATDGVAVKENDRVAELDNTQFSTD